ncbi:sugar ABC transporter permease [Halanaerobium sp. Z-7514]|uniref:Sugar ABC transporter permease n=1 Tax=Halanaerobium polyolivorans TaxID=2886943 RepID=A0AAW4WSH8_9FIRM|nr:sugar ABC transporter permease [Halanaerobium polyolivorans]MCC3144057.1 sugar ABC transporter permease [Halanaerobium polyolivorans]
MKLSKLKFSSDDKIAYTFILPSFIIIVSMLGYPMIFAFNQSFQDVTVFNEGSYIGLTNYINAFQDAAFMGSFGRSFVFVGFSMIGAFLIGLIIALLLNRDIFGRGFLRALIILPFIVSEVSVGVIWQWLLSPQLGVLNRMLSAVNLPTFRWLSNPFLAMVSIIMANTWRLTPFVVLILLAGLQGIDKSFYEAAEVAGANHWQKFKSITLPMIKPMMLVTLVYLSFASFNQFSVIFSLTGGGPGNATEVIALNMYQNAFQHFNYGYGSALAILLFLLNVALSLFYTKVLD